MREPGPTTRGKRRSSVEALLDEAYIASGLLHNPLAAIRASLEAARAAERSRALWTQCRALGLLIAALVELERYDEAMGVVRERGSVLLALRHKSLAEVEQRLGLLLYGKATARGHAELLRVELDAARRANDTTTMTAVAPVLTVVLWEAGKTKEALRLAKATAQVARLVQDPHQKRITLALCGACMATVTADASRDDLAEAEQCLDLALAEGEGGCLPTSYTASALGFSASVRGRLGRPEEGIAYADRRAELCYSVGANREVFESLALAAALSSAADDDLGAEERAQAALELVEKLQGSEDDKGEVEPDRIVHLRFSLGQYQLWAGHAKKARMSFMQVAKLADNLYIPEQFRAEILLWRGRSFQHLGEHERARVDYALALATAEKIVASVPSDCQVLSWETGDIRQVAAMAGMDLAQEHMVAGTRPGVSEHERQSHHQRARDMAEKSVSMARQAGVPTVLAQALEVCGRVLAEHSDAACLEAFAEASTIMDRQGQPWHVADIGDSTGRALVFLGRVEEAIPVLRKASQGYASCDDLRSAGLTGIVMARSLVTLGRLDEAFAAFGVSLNHFDHRDPIYRQTGQEYAQLLASSGYREAAEALRAEIGQKVALEVSGM